MPEWWTIAKGGVCSFAIRSLGQIRVEVDGSLIHLFEYAYLNRRDVGESNQGGRKIAALPVILFACTS